MSPRSPVPVVLLAGLCACGGEESYAADHAAEIQHDCEQSVYCHSSRGDSLPADPLNRCLDDAASALDAASDAQRGVFESAFRRCGTLRGCEYYDCTQMDLGTAQDFVQAHAAEIRFECDQIVTCMIANGQSLPATASDECAMQSAAKLQVASPSEQTVFLDHVNRCKTQLGCAYTSCP